MIFYDQLLGKKYWKRSVQDVEMMMMIISRIIARYQELLRLSKFLTASMQTWKVESTSFGMWGGDLLTSERSTIVRWYAITLPTANLSP